MERRRGEGDEKAPMRINLMKKISIAFCGKAKAKGIKK